MACQSSSPIFNQRSMSLQSVERPQIQTSQSVESGYKSQSEEISNVLDKAKSWKRKKHRTPDSKQHEIRGFLPVFKSASCKPSSNKKVCQSSSPSLNQRSMSPQPIERQQIQTSRRASSENRAEVSPFDIFRTAFEGQVKLDKPLLGSKRKAECAKNASGLQYLRSGMVLLKNFICHTDQVKIVKRCRDLGIGRGGFYRPGYGTGSERKLHLQMMCLGMNWDLQSGKYSDSRSFDDSVPPEIPEELKKQVDDALCAAHKFLWQSSKSEMEIPNMSPDICIVNFYSKTGKLGLHQDKDESKESLKKGLPVVSFSIGDSAEFLYSEKRNVRKAKKVILESGDVLIFGGKSRLIFHGVSCIGNNTAPQLLIDETNLRPGRLNLTFRQY